MSKEEELTNDVLRGELETGLLKTDLSDFAAIGEDALELGIDALLEDGVLKDIPMLSIAAKLYSAASKLYTYKIQKNILHFFQEYSRGNIDELKREEFLAQFQEDKNYRRDVLDIILLSMAKYNDAIQARVLANLIVSHLNGLIDFSQLRACEFALDKLNPVAYEYLNQLSMSETPYTTHRENPDHEALLYSAGIASRYGSRLAVSQIGKDLHIYGLKPLTP
jgi:hypothetical protein